MTSAQARLLIPGSKAAQRILFRWRKAAICGCCTGKSGVGPKTREGSNFDSDRLGIRVNVRLGEAHAKCTHTVKGSHAVEDRMGERFLEIVAAGSGKLGHLRTEEVVVPGFRRMVLGRRGEIVQPDLDIDQQPLRRPDLEIVEADIRLNLEALKDDSRGANLEVGRN